MADKNDVDPATTPIDIKDTANAIAAYVLLIKRRVKDPEVLRMGSRLLLKLKQLKQQVGDVYYDKPDRERPEKDRQPR